MTQSAKQKEVKEQPIGSTKLYIKPLCAALMRKATPLKDSNSFFNKLFKVNNNNNTICQTKRSKRTAYKQHKTLYKIFIRSPYV